MKRFFRNAVIFAALLVVLDILFGVVFRFLRANAKGGSPKTNYYIAEECDEEILIFGSSRARYHYNPAVFTDALGYTCYNCGKDGAGSVLAYARFNMITDRYNPKLILYDVSSFDYVADDYTKYLGELKPFYDNRSAREIIDSFSKPLDRIMMNSNMFRYNSCIVRYVLSAIGKPKDDQGGYVPLHGKLSEDYVPPAAAQTQEPVDEKKLALITGMIQRCKERSIALVFFVSPIFDGVGNPGYQTIKSIAEENDILFLDYSDYEKTVFHYELFQDRTHMNEDGAAIYTQQVIRDLLDHGVISAKE